MLTVADPRTTDRSFALAAGLREPALCDLLRGEPNDKAGRRTSMTKIPSSHRHKRRTAALLGSAIASALVLVSCGGEGRETVGAGGGPDEGSSAEVAMEVECGSSVFDLNDFANAPPASSLPDGPAGATDDAGAPAFDPSQAWKVVQQSEQRVDLLRELEEPLDTGGGDIRTHEARALEQINGANNIPDGTWLLTSAGPCVPRLITDSDLGYADLTLAETPSPDATFIELLVRERACASGAPATGRIELVELRETPEQVSIRVGVRPREGGQDCPENPPTPFVVELSEPLAARSVVDASVVPPRVVPVDNGV